MLRSVPSTLCVVVINEECVVPAAIFPFPERSRSMTDCYGV